LSKTVNTQKEITINENTKSFRLHHCHIYDGNLRVGNDSDEILQKVAQPSVLLY